MKLGIYLFIIVGGLLQAAGSAMNAQLFRSLKNPWLASLVSFALIVAFFACAFAVVARPLPSASDVKEMPWWAPLGGLVGAVAVYAGLKFVGEVGAGPYTAISVTAAIIASLVIDHFGLLRVEAHPITLWRMLGALMMAGGVSLIAKS